MAEEPRKIIMDEESFFKLKSAISDLYHAVCNVKYTEYVNPDKNRVPFTKEEKELIADLYSQGLNVYQISKHMGRKYGSVKNHIRRKVDPK